MWPLLIVHIRPGAVIRHPRHVVRIVRMVLLQSRPLLPTLGDVVLGAHAGQQVEQEAEDVGGEDEGDGPLDHGGDVLLAGEGGAGEDDGERDLDQDEDQLHPETDPQDAVVAVVDPQPLVLGADEHGREHVARDEEQEEPVVQARVVVGVEDGEQDQARGAREAEDDGEDAEDLLRPARVGHQPARVAEPALGREPGVQEDGGDHRAGDEERLEAVRARVGDVGDGLLGFHRGQVGFAFRAPDDQEGEQHA